MKETENALNYVKKLIADLNNELPVNIKVGDIQYVSFVYIFKIFIVDKIHKIEFVRSIIDDLEVALEKYKGTRYFDTLESSIKFTIYIELGREGLLKGFDISRKIISDKRDWIKDYLVDTRFTPELEKTFLDGLKNLINFFNSQIEKHKSLDIGFSEIVDNKDWVQGLINYYDSNKHLNSPGVKTKNLQFLKAAALERIMDLEDIRRSETMPSTLKAIDKKINYIVNELRKAPFLDIELPDFVHDMVSTR